MRSRKHGAAVAAPDESGFVDGESPKPGPVGAKNAENARKFLEFIMKPENIALQSNYALSLIHI